MVARGSRCVDLLAVETGGVRRGRVRVACQIDICFGGFDGVVVVVHRSSVDPDIDEAMFGLIEDLIYSQQLARGGWVKGVGPSTRSNPKLNLTGDPYFTAGYRIVLMFDRRPRSVKELELFDWDEGPISYRVERLKTDRQKDFDEQQ